MKMRIKQDKLFTYKSYQLQDSIDLFVNNINHSITTRSADFSHNAYETIAQVICSSMAIAKGIGGWVYTIQRRCPHQQTCLQICNSLHLRVLDSQTSHLPWSAIGALHVYKRRPASVASRFSSTLGLKVLWLTNYELFGNCGPNYCCCGVRW